MSQETENPLRQPILHLASGSPRRRELLIALGIDHTAGGADVDEQRQPGEAPADMALRLATLKARSATVGAGSVVLGADTVVVLDDLVFGKPANRDDALAMLAALSDRPHFVMTGVALVADDKIATALSTTEVLFREIRPDEALRYWQSGEPQDKAGAYAIQGLGGMFVRAISGSYSGVVGLPVFETAELLRDAGIDIFGVARSRASKA